VARSQAAGHSEVIEQVRLAQEGSAQAFALLYDRYVDQIFGYVYHRVGHRQTAEDLVGDVFLRALRRISTFTWQGVDFGAWLMTIARNRVHDHFKSARFRLEATVEEIFDSPEHNPEDDPEHPVLSADTARQVREALAQLNGEQAEVLYLRFLQHLSVAETAAVMGKSEGAVKALQYRALKSLSKHIPESLVPLIPACLSALWLVIR
jgi:RNA polymerase sigma-70 factor, ECF subfamily